MNSRQTQVLNLLTNKQLVKVISGIANFNLERVEQVVRAAEAAGAGAVDVAAQADVVRFARQTTHLPIFASAVNAESLAIAIENGADVAEIGNFDALYEDGFYLSAQDVIELTQKTIDLLPQGTPISVTVPGYLSVEAQIQLAKQLQAMGVAMIQTEGACRVLTISKTVQLLPAVEKARLTFENTQALCANVQIPVMSASGITADNAVNAFDYGAAAIGIGSAVNKLASKTEMVKTLETVMASLHQRPVVDAGVLYQVS